MKKVISMVLALLMIISSVSFMVACGSGTPGDTETKKPSTDVPDDGDNEVTHKVPKQDFDGETFNSFAGPLNTVKYYYFTDEEAAGDPIKEALWQRSELIKEHLNCNITPGTHPEQNVLCSCDSLSGLEITKTAKGIRLNKEFDSYTIEKF